MQLIRSQIPVPQSVVGPAHGERESLLALEELGRTDLGLGLEVRQGLEELFLDLIGPDQTGILSEPMLEMSETREVSS